MEREAAFQNVTAEYLTMKKYAQVELVSEKRGGKVLERTTYNISLIQPGKSVEMYKEQ